MKFTISIIFVKIKVENVKKLMCYNCNQINYIKRDCSQSDKKTARIHAMKINNDNNLQNFQEDSLDDLKKD